MPPDSRIHPANWPSQPGNYKVVQLQVDGEPCLFFASQDDLHENMLSSLGQILGRSVPEADFPLPGSGLCTERRPALRSDWYEVAGMGSCMIIEMDNRREAIFHGDSYHYRIGISGEHLDRMRSLVSDWNLKLYLPSPPP